MTRVHGRGSTKQHRARSPGDRLDAASLNESHDHHDHQYDEKKMNEVSADVEGHPAPPAEEENEDDDDEQ